jgi:hypothetical protein
VPPRLAPLALGVYDVVIHVHGGPSTIATDCCHDGPGM